MKCQIARAAAPTRPERPHLQLGTTQPHSLDTADNLCAALKARGRRQVRQQDAVHAGLRAQCAQHVGTVAQRRFELGLVLREPL
jgi:hypothetical protein